MVMNLSTANYIVGLLVCIGSLLVATRFQKRGVKISVILLGILLGGVIAFFPSIRDLINSPKLPGDVEILRLLYGPAIEIQQSPDGQSVFVLEQLSETEKEQFNYAAQVQTQIIYRGRGWENNPQRFILLTKTGPPECCDRSLLPVLGGAVLVWENGMWQVASYQKLITPFQGFDQISEAKIIQLGTEKTGIVLQDWVAQNNQSQTWDMIISSVDGRLKPVIRIETLANNADCCPPIAEDEPCWTYAAKYDFVPGDDPDYDDIQVRVSGTKLVGGEPVSFDEIREYVFLNGEYKPKNK
jgi:hypothetical protein